MSPIVVPSAIPAEAIRDVRLGRLRLLTTYDDLKEAFGDGTDAVGDTVFAAERKPRAFPLNVPVRGHAADTDPGELARRLRRQLRALMENPQARLQGLWYEVAFDLDVSGWLVVGTAELDPTEGGSTFSEWALSLTDCYRVGGPRTHREGRRVWVLDRRLSTSSRDHLGTIYSTDFAAQTAVPLAFLPVGASDVLSAAGVLLTPLTVASLDGDVPYIGSLPDREVIDFERLVTDQGKGDVVALDRRGITDPAYTAAGDAAPQAEYGWEELYGIDQPITEGDAPVLQNGRARIRWVAARSAVAVDSYDGTLYTEVGRVSFWDSVGPAQFTTLRSARLVEWTPERAVVLLAIGSGTRRAEVYMTLQRGWAGPRFELYTSTITPRIRLVPNAAGGAVTLGRSDGTVAVADGTFHGDWATREPWLYLLGPTPLRPMHAAVLAAAVGVTGRDDTSCYGSTVKGVDLATPSAKYQSAQLGAGVRGAETGDAQLLGRANLYDVRPVPTLVAR